MINDIRNGYVGYNFQPYNYDFFLYNVGSSYAEYGNFESTVFQSRSYVKGATLWEYSSKDIERFTEADYKLIGDGLILEHSGEAHVVTRSGNE